MKDSKINDLSLIEPRPISQKLNYHNIFIIIGSITLILLIIYLLIMSMGLDFSNFLSYNITIHTLLMDLSYSFVRVTFISLLAWVAAIIFGAILKNNNYLRLLTNPAINLIRHISPFAWFPFAIIWFGLGEYPIAFVLLVTLFFPALLAAREIFSDIPQEYIDEATVCGANMLQLFFYVELRLTIVQLINLFRILWGLGWTAVIAVEMLGTAQGLGYILLDFRYLLFYEEMILYIAIMGIVGVLIDHGLARITVFYKN